MRTQTDIETSISLLKFRIEVRILEIDRLVKHQRELLRTINDVGNVFYYNQMKSSIIDTGNVIISLKKEVKNFEHKLEHDKNYLLSLLNKNS